MLPDSTLSLQNVAAATCRVAMLEEELGRMNPDMSAIAAFQAKEAEYAQRVSDLEAATAERDNVSWLFGKTSQLLCILTYVM